MSATSLALSSPARAVVNPDAKKQQDAIARTETRQLREKVKDREFLAAAVELIETPPSPARVAFLGVICAAFAALVAWSYFATLEIHAVAQGKVQPSGRSKVIQPLEPGKVSAIRVENGTAVRTGDVLIELDPTETNADVAAIRRDLQSIEAEIGRRQAAIAWSHARENPVPQIAYAPATDDSIRTREDRVLAAETAQLSASIDSLVAQLSERRAQRQRLEMSIAARERLLTYLKERVDSRQHLDDNGQGYRARVLDALEQYERERTLYVGEQGQRIENDAGIISLERKISEAQSQFVAEQNQHLLEAERKRDRATQDLIKATSRNERTVLRAPIDGTIQQLAVSTIGQVVSSGQPLLTVVPLDGAIEVEALILNGDIGFVELGQPAIVKVEAFPFTRYGTIDGKVVKVSRDAVDERDATALTDAATSARPSISSTGQTSGRHGLVFPVTIELSQRAIHVDSKDIPLSPGMTVTVEIKTGKRRAIDYVLAPLGEILAASGHER
jgi:hemolysin D